MAAVENTGRGRAVTALNDLQSLLQSIYSLNTAAEELITRITDQELQSIWQALGTCALNADGSLGAVDVSPNNDHPINPSTAPGMNHVVTCNQYIAAQTALGNVMTAIQANIDSILLMVEHS